MNALTPPTIGLLLAAAVAAPRAAQEDGARLEPDPVLAAAIEDALSPATEEALEHSLERLRELARPDPRALVCQLFLYSESATTTKGAMAFGVLAEQLRIPDLAIVRALVPLLETRDAARRRALGGVLAEFEHASVDRPPSFAIYRPFLEEPMRAGAAPPPGLVRHLYETDAGSALLLLARLDRLERHELAEILWAEHVIADVLWKHAHGFLPPDRVEPAAAGELARLAAHGRWWARLYALRVMGETPAFRDPAAIRRLADDAHPLVREAALELVEERRRRGH